METVQLRKTDQNVSSLCPGTWYYRGFVVLDERTGATVALGEARTRFTETSFANSEALMERLRIAYDGHAEPIEIEWIRGRELR